MAITVLKNVGLKFLQELRDTILEMDQPKPQICTVTINVDHSSGEAEVFVWPEIISSFKPLAVKHFPDLVTALKWASTDTPGARILLQRWKEDAQGGRFFYYKRVC